MSRVAWITLSVATLGIVIAAVAVLATGQTKSASPAAEKRLAEDPSALALGKHDGDVLVGIAAKRGGPIQVTALRAETPLSTGDLSFELDGNRTDARSCGDGCSRIDASVLDGESSRLTVRVGASAVAFELPARLPPSGDSIFAHALKTMDDLRTYRFVETLTSGRGGITTQYEVQAPNRLSLRTKGYGSVIIGKSRWDYHDGRWERGSFPGLNVADVLMWSHARHARVVGRRPNGVTELAAFGLLPVPAWFRLAVAPTGRVVEAEMTAPSHFMVHRYNDFNGRIAIFPPAHPIKAPK